MSQDDLYLLPTALYETEFLIFIPQGETESEFLENTKATFRELPACYLFALETR